MIFVAVYLIALIVCFPVVYMFAHRDFEELVTSRDSAAKQYVLILALILAGPVILLSEIYKVLFKRR